jgi:hypothetical protein
VRTSRRDTAVYAGLVAALPLLVLLAVLNPRCACTTPSPEPLRVALLVGAVWAVLGTLVLLHHTRSHVSLRQQVGAAAVLVVRGPFRGRLVDLTETRTVRIVRIRTGRVPLVRSLLLAEDDTVVASVQVAPDFWRREDVWAFLRRVGIRTEGSAGAQRARTIEAAYPGATSWFERHRVLAAVVACPVILVLFGGTAQWLGL